MVIFHCYVSLPEGKTNKGLLTLNNFNWLNPWDPAGIPLDVHGLITATGPRNCWSPVFNSPRLGLPGSPWNHLEPMVTWLRPEPLATGTKRLQGGQVEAAWEDDQEEKRQHDLPAAKLVQLKTSDCHQHLQFS
jgi:hypothetical protein